MFRTKFPTKHIFRIFPILKINRMAPFCKLIYGTTLVLWNDFPSDVRHVRLCRHCRFSDSVSRLFSFVVHILQYLAI